MNLDKTTAIANLKDLETVIDSWHNLYHDTNPNSSLTAQTYQDLMWIRNLMDDIECDRITELPLVERTNMLSGKTFLEEADTPVYCSPASESYWSM